MVAYISRTIEKSAKISIEKGQAKYRAYFVNTDKYLEFKKEVDEILIIDGLKEVIVTE